MINFACMFTCGLRICIDILHFANACAPEAAARTATSHIAWLQATPHPETGVSGHYSSHTSGQRPGLGAASPDVLWSSGAPQMKQPRLFHLGNPEISAYAQVLSGLDQREMHILDGGALASCRISPMILSCIQLIKAFKDGWCIAVSEYEDVDYYRTTEHPVFEVGPSDWVASVEVTAELLAMPAQPLYLFKQDGSSVEAFVYVWVEQLRHLLYGDWDYQEFRSGPQFQPYVQVNSRCNAPC